MYQSLIIRGAGALDQIVLLRNWCRPLWGLLALMWLAVMITLFFLYVSPVSTPPTAVISGVKYDLDKFVHVLAHAGTTLLPLAVVPIRRLAWTMVGVAIVCGLGFEFAQFFVPERSFELSDLVANFLGLLIGVRGGRFVRELYPRLP
jgi:VanZ family protein